MIESIKSSVSRPAGSPFSSSTRIARALLALLVLALLSMAGPLLAVEPGDDSGRAARVQSAPAAIDLNRAGVSELQSIKGIGPALAKRIVEHRGRHGAFEKIEDLLEVKGVGPKLLDRIRTRIVVKPVAKKTS